MLDYIIVGFGISGLSFAEQLRKEGKEFVVIDQEKESSSLVAGGMYNPVILKRFTSPWNATEQLNYAIPFYKCIERFLDDEFLQPFPVLRIFNAIEEQNNWLIASDKPSLSAYLSSKFVLNTNKSIEAKYNYGEVLQAGRLHVAKLLQSYKLILLSRNQYSCEKFKYDALHLNSDSVTYKTLTAKKIVFAEGYGMVNNPYFNYLPLNGTKGEVLIIKADELQLNSIVKSGVFIIPLEVNNHYLVGATYHWTDKTWGTTLEAQQELKTKLDLFLKCDYEIVNQLAGIRPTVKDRKPLVGSHPKHHNMYILNGMGTRGVMVAPITSKQLYDAIEHNVPPDEAINITRFHASS